VGHIFVVVITSDLTPGCHAYDKGWEKLRGEADPEEKLEKNVT